MSDTQTSGGRGETRIMAIVCYALFIAAVTNGFTAVAGVVLAYINRAEARGTIWESHFRNLISLFWSSVAVCALFLAAVLFGVLRFGESVQHDTFPGVLFLLPVLWMAVVGYAVWYLYRAVKGVVQAIDNKAFG